MTVVLNIYIIPKIIKENASFISLLFKISIFIKRVHLLYSKFTLNTIRNFSLH